MSYRYYIPNDIETIADARAMDGDYSCPEEAAEEAAAYEHSNCDGWNRDWPMTFAIINENGKETLVRVEREFEPFFTGEEVQS